MTYQTTYPDDPQRVERDKQLAELLAEQVVMPGVDVVYAFLAYTFLGSATDEEWKLALRGARATLALLKRTEPMTSPDNNPAF